MSQKVVLKSLTFALIINLIAIFEEGKSDEKITPLYREILKEYEKDVRPSIRHDSSVNVSFFFALTQIIDVDERNQIITTNAWIQQSWVDNRLIWDPDEFDNLTSIHIPHEHIWKPDIILYNNADSHYKESLISTDVLVSFSGNVSWSIAAILKSSCSLDVRYYPFDYQNCVLKFASWAYDGTKIDLTLNSEKGSDTNFVESTEWQLKLIRAEKNEIIYSCCPEPYPFIDVHISIERRPMFYIFHLILPCVLISAIALLGFYMPSDSGEKVTLGITSLLSSTVFLMLVAEKMPPTSEALPLIGIYYGATIVIVSLATSMTVVTLNIHYYGNHGDPVPPLIKSIVFDFLARFLCVHQEKYFSVNDRIYRSYNDDDSVYFPTKVSRGEVFNVERDARACNGNIDNGRTRMLFNSEENELFDGSFGKELFNAMHRLHITIVRNEMRLVEKQDGEYANLEWQQVALVLDRLLLIIFVFGTTFTSLAIIYQPQIDFH